MTDVITGSFTLLDILINVMMQNTYFQYALGFIAVGFAAVIIMSFINLGRGKR